jgi:transposase InsO family protein
MSKRRTHSPEFKARVAMEAISGRKTIQEIAADHAIHPIRAATLECRLDELGVLRSFSRPRVSNDNPYSESLFRTAKYRPDYPSRPFTSKVHGDNQVGGSRQLHRRVSERDNRAPIQVRSPSDARLSVVTNQGAVHGAS